MKCPKCGRLHKCQILPGTKGAPIDPEDTVHYCDKCGTEWREGASGAFQLPKTGGPPMALPHRAAENQGGKPAVPAMLGTEVEPASGEAVRGSVVSPSRPFQVALLLVLILDILLGVYATILVYHLLG